MLDAKPAPPGPDGRPAALLPVKAVPGAKRDAIAGLLGDRLKVRVCAPPEGGRANRAICELVANHLGLKPSQVTLVGGASSPDKVLRIDGVDAQSLKDHWPT